MRGLLHPRRFLWLFGLTLLLGTAAGAGWMLNHSNAQSDTPVKNNKDGSLPFDGKFIIAFAYVDVLPGVTKIYPLVSGQVTWVVEEATFVPKGKELLQLDDEMAKSDLKKAKIALANSQNVLGEAQRFPKKQELELKAQAGAIKALQAEKKVIEGQVAKLKDLQKKGVGGSDFDLKSGEAKVEKLDALIEIEESKLAILKEFVPGDKIEQAKLDVDLKKELVHFAQLALSKYTVVAPVDGTVLRAFTNVGETLGSNPKMPAIEFCPKLKRIIRAEVQQEYADRLKLGQMAIIEDDTTTGLQWKGKVVRISDWFTHRRSIIQEPFQFNDVRTLECIIEVTDEPQGQTLKIGQRMRVMINQGGP